MNHYFSQPRYYLTKAKTAIHLDLYLPIAIFPLTGNSHNLIINHDCSRDAHGKAEKADDLVTVYSQSQDQLGLSLIKGRSGSCHRQQHDYGSEALFTRKRAPGTTVCCYSSCFSREISGTPPIGKIASCTFPVCPLTARAIKLTSSGFSLALQPRSCLSLIASHEIVQLGQP